MKYLYLTLVALLCSVAFASAQMPKCNYGVRAGVNFANVANSDFSSDYQTGFNIGGVCLIPLSSVVPVSIETGLSFQMKGARDKGYIARSLMSTHLETYSLEIPVMVNYSIPLSGKWALQPVVGLYYNIALSGSLKAGDESFNPYKSESIAVNDSNDPIDAQLMHRSDFGIRAGLSALWGRYLLGFAYDAGLLNIYTKEFRDRGYQANTGCFSINLGCNF